MTSDLRMHHGGGVAVPVHATDLLPALFDSVCGTADLRAAWLAANEEGREAERTYRAALKAARLETPEASFGDREAWITATDYRCRDLAAEVDRCTRRSMAALRALDKAQSANYGKAVENATSLLVEADTNARDALEGLREALADRETAALIARVRTDGWASHARFIGAPLNSTRLLLDDLGIVVAQAFTFNGRDALAEQRAAMASPLTSEERLKATARAKAAPKVKASA